MFDTIFGLPTHVLVVHLVVVLIPVAALFTAAGAIFPRWRRLAWWIAATDFVALVAAWVAKESGEKLAHRLFPDGNRPSEVSTHVHRGSDLFFYMIGLFLIAVVFALVAGDRKPLPGRLPRLSMPHLAVPVYGVYAVALLALAGAVLVTVEVILVGHSGSAAVWKGVVQATH